MLVLLVGMVWYVNVECRPAVRAAQGHGTPGTFLIETTDCGKNCVARGVFTSADRTIVRTNIEYQGHLPHGAGVDDTIPALDSGGIGVYARKASLYWLVDGLVLIFWGAVTWALGQYTIGAVRRWLTPPATIAPDWLNAHIVRRRRGRGEIGEKIADDERMALMYDTALRSALHQRERRRLAREIAANDPALAATLAIGRPDLDRTFVDGGLVDINAVPTWVLADLPGFTADLADRVALARDRPEGIHSVADLVVYADVPAEIVEALDEVLLFSPGPAGTGPTVGDTS